MTDLRTRRTTAAIDRAMYQLLAKQQLATASVAQICRAAGITRSTFYQYYLDKDDWLGRQVGYYLVMVTQCPLTEDLQALIAQLRPEAKKVLALLAVHQLAGDLAQEWAQYFAQAFVTQTPQATPYQATLYAEAVVQTITWQLQHGDDQAAITTFKRVVEAIKAH
ncbi:MAG: TetR family transcriptional regulator [Lactobacillus sp.]|jgi:AcrR family transcriptional regulator|nr:TetR family transcriptional regulator [Lactobacillus sp.]MCI2032507.1 TetR family transcriptional regulator [Lactobacillus sp.]